MSAFALVGARLFDGERLHEGEAVVVENGRIREVGAADALPENIERRPVEGLLAPGFIDIQVNGGGGVLFNDSPSVGTISAIGAAHRKFGTTSFLPTLITDSREKMMAAAVEAVRAGIAAGMPGLLGVHLEGPFLNPDRKGVHDPKYMERRMDDEDIRIMTSLPEGRTLVTLAPEREEIADSNFASQLAEAGVIVAAGHTAARYEILEKALGQGLRGYTHLFNAMPPLMGREPGPVGAALDQAETWVSLIVDLQHVSAPSLRIALAAKPLDKVILITDAMPSVGSSLGAFTIQGRTIYRRNGRLETEDGTLAGADLDMATAVRNTHRHLGIDLGAALAMASRVPATFLRLDRELGCLAPGYRANMVLLDGGLAVRSTWIDGVEERVE
jgi:N-acetylglucosamine-6-phosphate deacetylase